MRISINPIFDNTWLVCLIGAILFGLLLLQPAFTAATPPRRRTLLLLRGAVIALLVLVMLRPSLIRTEQREVATTVSVLLDTSRSMQVEDAGDQSRFEAMRAAVRECLRLASASEVPLDFEFYAFDAEAQSIQTIDDQLPRDVGPEGKETDIGNALNHVLQQHQAQRLGAVILMTDGAVRTYAPVVDLRRSVTELARQGTALYPITFGRSRDQSQSRDVGLANLPDQMDVFAKNRIPITASLQVSGYVGRDIPVTMTIEDPAGQQQSMGPLMLTANEDGEVLDVEFAYVPESAGQHKLTLAAAVQPEEQVIDNNQMTAYLNVREGGLRVLFLCGNLGWQEQKFIRRALASSEDIDVDFRWIDMRLRAQWPTDLGPTLDDASYDVALIADVPAAALGRAQCQLLAIQVRDGKGLMMLGGKFSFGPGNYSETALAEVLPVVMTRLERQDFDAPLRADMHLEGPLRMLPRGSHFVTRISSEDGDLRWDELPPLQGANRFSSLTPSGRVLAESTRGDSLLVASEYGLGRVLAFAGDSTYRWYRSGAQTAHKRFWRQAILWLAKKDDQGDQQISIMMEQRRFPAGGAAEFEVLVEGGTPQADNAEVSSPMEVTAFHVDPLGQKTSVSLVKQPDGRFRGKTDTLTMSGEHQIEAEGVLDGALIATQSLPFQILDEDIEMSDPAANPIQMAMLAQLTQESGGRAVVAEQLTEVIDEITTRAADATTDYESKWQLTDTPWDAWSVFLVMVGLLSTDWYCRKKWQMV